jgi:hypothetical protein
MKLEDNHQRLTVFVAESDHDGHTGHAARLMPGAQPAGLATP